MEKSIKRQHSAEFKLQVVLALLKQEKTMSQICSEFKIHITQARRWKEKALEGMRTSLNTNGAGNQKTDDQSQLIEELYKQIGQLKVEADWFKKKVGYAL
jgi:putative transposase